MWQTFSKSPEEDWPFLRLWLDMDRRKMNGHYQIEAPTAQILYGHQTAGYMIGLLSLYSGFPGSSYRRGSESAESKSITDRTLK